jgi:hypothetical protein
MLLYYLSADNKAYFIKDDALSDIFNNNNIFK